MSRCISKAQSFYFPLYTPIHAFPSDFNSFAELKIDLCSAFFITLQNQMAERRARVGGATELIYNI